MTKFVTFDQIRAAQEHLAFQWDLGWLTRLSYRTRASLKFIRRSGRETTQLWPVHALVEESRKRYARVIPDQVELFAQRLERLADATAPVATATKRAKPK